MFGKDREPSFVSHTNPEGLQEEVDHFSKVLDASADLLKNTRVSSNAAFSGKSFSREQVLSPYEAQLIKDVRSNARDHLKTAKTELAEHQNQVRQQEKNNSKKPQAPRGGVGVSRPLTFRPV